VPLGDGPPPPPPPPSTRLAVRAPACCVALRCCLALVLRGLLRYCLPLLAAGLPGAADCLCVLLPARCVLLPAPAC
jgi:hypothetical protein